MLKIFSNYKAIDEQKKAISKLYKNLKTGNTYQVLEGVTGSGKTFTIANLIQKTKKPALIISHNKTLAAQLYQEYKSFFPDAAVSYFVSYYDYYQPEAYIPSTDTYIEKDADINEFIDKLRLAATANILSRKDVIVVASVSCIYNIGSPEEYNNFTFAFKAGDKIERTQLIKKLVDLQYERSDFGFKRSTFRVRGDNIDIFSAYDDFAYRISLNNHIVSDIKIIDPISGDEIKNISKKTLFYLFPAKHYMVNRSDIQNSLTNIKKDADIHAKYLRKKGKLLEAQRIIQKVNYDIEMISELGYVKGIENYSRYFDKRMPGDPPYCLINYFNKAYGKDWLMVVDESHITFPQIRGMYNGDQSRKQTLIEYGFRLPSSLDNRPLKFDEFLRLIPNYIASSATPGDWELSYAKENSCSEDNILVKQLIRPTGIPDPEIIIRPTDNQVNDIIFEIKNNSLKKQRSLVTTLSKATAEDLSKYLNDKNIKAHYLHSDIHTLERTDILEKLRNGTFDCIIGVNLLREGLDLPEVSLVAILDADKEGFLRSRVSLVQTIGRASRNIKSRVILYADTKTKSINDAVDEITKKRKYQLEYNKIHNIKPSNIVKPIRNKILESEEYSDININNLSIETLTYKNISKYNLLSYTPYEKKILLQKLKREMKNAADRMDFESAIFLRNKINEISS